MCFDGTHDRLTSEEDRLVSCCEKESHSPMVMPLVGDDMRFVLLLCTEQETVPASSFTSCVTLSLPCLNFLIYKMEIISASIQGIMRINKV